MSVLSASTKRETGKTAQLGNITAAKVLQPLALLELHDLIEQSYLGATACSHAMMDISNGKNLLGDQLQPHCGDSCLRAFHFLFRL